MISTDAPSKKQKLKLFPLHCMIKGNDDDVSSLRDMHQAPKTLEVPQPIDEFVDYTIDAYYERSLKSTQRTLEVVFAPQDESDEVSSPCSSCESGQSAVEEVIEVAVVGQAETGVPSSMNTKQQQQPSMGNAAAASLSVPHSVRLAEGLSVGSDKSPRATQASEEALQQLGDLMTVDAPDDAEGLPSQLRRAPVKESLVDARATVSLNASQSATDTARSYSGDPSDVQALKRTVRRLTSELSRLLMAHRPDGKSPDEVDAAKLLPGKGPLPPWLCEPRVFAPLMAAYEQQLLDCARAGGGGGGDRTSEAVDARLLDMEARVLDVVRENERLRVKLREAATAGPAGQTEWDVFAEQARLVLEENQLLLRQLGVQQDKAQLAQRGFFSEVAKLKSRIEELEAENAQVRGNFDSLHDKLQEVKSKYQAATLERETGEMKTVDCMRSLNKELVEAREDFARSNEELLRQLQKSESEKVKLTKALADATSERDELRLEVSELTASAKLRSKESVHLHKSTRKREALQDYLESVVDAATELQAELDACNEKLAGQEAQLTGLVCHLVMELQFHEKNITGQAFDEESVNKLPKLTSKFEFVIKRFASLLKANEDKREQMDKQICYLQSLIREKSQQLHHLEAEQRTVEAGLETVWNSAVSS